MHFDLLRHDYISFKVGENYKKLYRIISTTSFDVDIPDISSKGKMLKSFITVHIPKHSIGGYVESVDNISTEGKPSWIDNNGKVYGKAVISNGTFVSDYARIGDNSKISNSYITDYARILNNANVVDSWIGDLAIVKDTASVSGSHVLNQTLIFNFATIKNSLILDGCYVSEKAIVENSTLKDISMAGGDAIVTNCNFSGRATATTGEVKSRNINFDLQLNSQIPKSFYLDDSI